MGRTNRSARQAGSRFERLAADYAALRLGDSSIDRQIKMGARDVGDIRGLRIGGKRLVLETKDYGGRLEVPKWLREAEAERGNADAEYGAVLAKRMGVLADARNISRMGDQLVLMTYDTLLAICAGGRDLLEDI